MDVDNVKVGILQPCRTFRTCRFQEVIYGDEPNPWIKWTSIIHSRIAHRNRDIMACRHEPIAYLGAEHTCARSLRQTCYDMKQPHLVVILY